MPRGDAAVPRERGLRLWRPRACSGQSRSTAECEAPVLEGYDIRDCGNGTMVPLGSCAIMYVLFRFTFLFYICLFNSWDEFFDEKF